MMKWFLGIGLLLVGMVCSSVIAAEPKPPIKALLITGGCCHDYSKQKFILPEGISARANVTWTIVQQGGSTTTAKIPYYENDDWAKGYDIVVHNECFADAADPQWTARVLRPHRAGTPAVVIHCAMHCYRDKTNDWFEFLGVTSRGHGANYPFEIENLAKDNKIMEKFGDKWMTPKGELYFIEKLWPTATPLAHAMSRDSKKNEVCIWTNDYRNTRVFGTTIGHHNEEMADPVFLDYMARGLLWACDKLNDDYLVPCKDPKFEMVPDPTANKPKGKDGVPTPAKGKPVKVMVPKNLAAKKPATASSVQEGHPVTEGNDEELSSRWCANGAVPGSWWQVDLGKPEEITEVRIAWEFAECKFKYVVEGSADGKEWKKLADETQFKQDEEYQAAKLNVAGIRHVRVTANELTPGAWPSFFECEVLGKEMVEKVIYEGTGRIPAKVRTKLFGGFKAPAGFRPTVFAAPPDAGYPVCLACTPQGDVYIGVDENGSIDAKSGRGRIVRARDEDGDGEADSFVTFAEMDSPRGICVDGNTVYVLHPPALTKFVDDNGDGKSDRQEVLVEGIGFDLKKRGADHTTNGMRLGIDGNLYVAVGDYGFVDAVGKDGTHLQLFGGGVARVRTDGTGLELVSQGQRNIYDVAVDPLMNLYTRDNTNDGGGWNVRLSHVIPSGNYGYPRLFINFPEEIVQPLADYGGGSPCGSMYIDEKRFAKDGDAAKWASGLYTCDWGRSIVYFHPMKAKGAGFEAEQESFCEIPRPTDMDIDGAGRIYISSWRDGGFTFSGPNVGFVGCLTPVKELSPLAGSAGKDLQKQTVAELVGLVGGESAIWREAAQRELLRRGDKAAEAAAELEKVALSNAGMPARVAAIFTLRQLAGAAATPKLVAMLERTELREFALRALVDDKRLAKDVPAEVVVKCLADENPRVRLIAAWSMPRVKLGSGDVSKLVTLAYDQDPLVAHVAANSLVAMKSGAECLEGLKKSLPAKENEAVVAAIARTLGRIHEEGVLKELIAIAKQPLAAEKVRPVLTAICRLSQTESTWDGSWWGTRPDTRGPYYKLADWSGSDEARKFLLERLGQSQGDDAKWLLLELQRHRVELGDTTAIVLKLAKDSPESVKVAGKLLLGKKDLPTEALEVVAKLAVDSGLEVPQRLAALRTLQGYHGADQREIAIRAVTQMLTESNPNNDLLSECVELAKRKDVMADLPKWQAMVLSDEKEPAKVWGAFAVLVAENNGAAEASKWVEKGWMNPAVAPSLLKGVALAKLEKYALEIGHLRESKDDAVKQAANAAYTSLALDVGLVNDGKPRIEISTQAIEDVTKAVLQEGGDKKVGERLFARQGCVSCHTTSPGQPLKGPLLAGISARYKRPELVESILRPSAKIAQGFETQLFVTDEGLTYEGFVVRESGEEVELRAGNGVTTVIPKDSIETRKKKELSVMPLGLADKLTAKELAAILAYLESLPAK